MPSARRFPPPWIIEEHNNACFIVKDATGQALAYFYFEEEPGRRSVANLLTQRRGAADGGEVRQAARAVAPDAADQRGVTGLAAAHTAVSAECRLSPQYRKYRGNALNDVKGQKQT
jgi:hypothetical protein